MQLPKFLRSLNFTLFALIFIEAVIVTWAYFTTDPEFFFDKCARNSGRLSSLILVFLLVYIGKNRLSKIYNVSDLLPTFKTYFILFSINHLIHLLFVGLNFMNHEIELDIVENLHGALTFVGIVVLPFIVFRKSNLDNWFYVVLVIHLLNLSYFVCQTFYSKITDEHPAYHNQLGILVICAGVLYLLHSIYRDRIKYRR